MHPYLYLTIAIIGELVGTSALKVSDGFSRFFPSVVAIASYGVAFYFLSLCLRSMPIGVVYAIWSGVGITIIVLIGWLFFKQSLDLAAIIGIGLIVIGVVVLNVFSKMSIQ